MSKITKKSSIDRKYILFGLRVSADFGATLAIPVVGLVALAQWYEQNHGGNAWYTFGAFLLAAGISGFLINKKAKKYGKEFDSIEKENKKST